MSLLLAASGCGPKTVPSASSRGLDSPRNTPPGRTPDDAVGGQPSAEAQRVARHVMLGLDDRAALIEGEQQRRGSVWVEDPSPHLVEAPLTRVQRQRVVADVDEALAAHQHVQGGWSRPTHTERLRVAFEHLEAAGVLARMAYGMHGPDALQLLQTEADHAASRGSRVRGYVYFDVQMLDEVVHRRLRLSWGSFDADGPTAGTLALGRTVVGALQAEGLEVSWPEDADAWIQLTSFDWAVPRDPDTGAPTIDVRAAERDALALE